MLNTFTWGPDGWLYGTHGVFTHSNVGKPGAPDSERQRLNGAIWRVHPTTRTFEVFAEGTSNPWGLDFNDYGHAFTTACVIEHLYHVIQGAPLHAPGRPALQPERLRRASRRWRITSTGSAARGRMPATAVRRQPAAGTPTPAR